MRYCSQILHVFLFWLILCSTAFSDDQRTLRYIDGEGLSPIIYKNEVGEILGVVPESVYLVFDALGMKLEGKLVPDARTLFELINGRAEVSTTILYANLKIDDFPEPITICPTSMLAFPIHTVWHREGTFSEEQTQTLIGVRTGMLNQPPGLEETAGFPYKNVTSFKSVDSMMKALITQRVDAIFMSWHHAQLISEKLGRRESIIQGPLVGEIQVHLALLTQAFKAEFIEKACDQVERFKSQGAFKRVFNAYLN